MTLFNTQLTGFHLLSDTFLSIISEKSVVPNIFNNTSLDAISRSKGIYVHRNFKEREICSESRLKLINIITRILQLLNSILINKVNESGFATRIANKLKEDNIINSSDILYPTSLIS